MGQKRTKKETNVGASTLCDVLHNRKTKTKMVDGDADEDQGDVNKVRRHVEKRDT